MQLAALYRKLFGPKPQPDPFAGVRFVSHRLVRPTTEHRCRFRKVNFKGNDRVYRCECGAWYGAAHTGRWTAFGGRRP